MAPKITLTYWNFEGRAFPVRAAFHIGGIEFEDKRLTREEYVAAKPSFPLGQMPLLEVDGVTYTQTPGMVRYACELAGLSPKEPVDILKVNEITEICGEIIYKIPSHKDADELKRLREEFVEGKLTKYMSFMDKRIEEAGKKHAILDHVTEADLFLAVIVNNLRAGIFDHIPKDFPDQFANIIRAFDALMDLDPIKAYIASRPQ
eukprot:TRINITY_DN10895_c0_g3_i2.p1 TRINITY_DN10895_c0_g3~~TRINITY_DN10895_c0_g3_i2.p1  ORF type:complete len:204 (+),score=68.76 TRINITY_DN10895_c0_g3_i2:329-940(+)